MRLLTAEELAPGHASVLVVHRRARLLPGPADPLVDALPDARLVVLPGADHFSTPKDFIAMDAALKFLADGSVDSESPRAASAAFASRFPEVLHVGEAGRLLDLIGALQVGQGFFSSAFQGG